MDTANVEPTPEVALLPAAPVESAALVPPAAVTPAVVAVVETREERGRRLARAGKIRQCGTRWVVPSQSKTGTYTVDLVDGKCTCPDYELRAVKCKHQHAVEFFIIWQSNPDGTVTETRAVRRTYKQEWPAYNGAQVHEKEHAATLLRALCEGIVQPPQVTGRPRLPLRDVVYAAVLKVFLTFSGRRAQSDIRAARKAGLVAKEPSYNSMFRYFESPALTPILKALIEESASPLKTVEHDFAVDSTGFGTKTYRRWFDEKYGEQTEQVWVKCHAMVGAKTNVITSVEVSSAADCPTLPPLVKSTAKRFKIREVSADKAYSSHYNVEAIHTVGAAPYIPFKENATGKGPELWRQMFALYMLKRPEFLAHYHKRSNVETTFSMVKAKFGAFVRSKLPVAQTNEVLAKCLCHNLCCLVSSVYETGLRPEFWEKAA